MLRQKFPKAGQFGSGCPHQVESGAAMNVNVKKSRSEDGVAKVNDGGVGWNILTGTRGNVINSAVLNEQQWVLNLFDGCEETSCGEYSSH